jgi:hypothetical protein
MLEVVHMLIFVKCYQHLINVLNFLYKTIFHAIVHFHWYDENISFVYFFEDFLFYLKGKYGVQNLMVNIETKEPVPNGQYQITADISSSGTHIGCLYIVANYQ